MWFFYMADWILFMLNLNETAPLVFKRGAKLKTNSHILERAANEQPWVEVRNLLIGFEKEVK